MSELLRVGHSDDEAAVSPPTWTRTTVDAPARWLDRTGRGPGQWTIHARRWNPPAVSREVPVVLIPGLGVGSGMCVPLARQLAIDGVTFALDLPGFGRSEKPRPALDIPEHADALAQWMRRAVGGPAVLVGVSIGSQVALSTAVRHPQVCAGVVLVSPTMDRERRRWRSQLPRWQLEQATQSMPLRMLQVRDYVRAGLPRVIHTMNAALRHAPEDDVTDLTLPALFCHGGRDPLVRREWARELAHQARSPLVSLPAAVHAMSYENPLELARVVNGFLDDLAADSSGSNGRKAA